MDMISAVKRGDFQAMDLISAVKRGNIQATEHALRSGADPNVKDMEGNVPLLFAVEQKKLSLVQLLLQHGADPAAECGTNDRSSPFAFALYTEDILMLENFIKHGIDLNMILPRENAPALILAVDLGSSRLVNLFLSYGANVNLIYEGITPLIKAIENKHIGITRTLLEHGARVQERNVDVTPLATALMTNDREIVDVILQYAQKEGVSLNSTFGGFAIAPLLLSAKFGLVNSTKVLLEAGCDANVTTQYGETALHFAVQGYSNMAIISILLEAGCNPFIADLQTGKRNTALHLACHLGNLTAVKILYSHMVQLWNKDERLCSGNRQKRATVANMTELEDSSYIVPGSLSQVPGSSIHVPVSSSHVASFGAESLPNYHSVLSKASNQYDQGVSVRTGQQTSQAMSSASQAVSSTSQGMSSASQAVSSASQAVSSASQAVSSASQAVSSASQAVSSASQAMSSTTQGMYSTTQGMSSITQAMSSTTQGMSRTTQAMSSTTQAMSSTSQAMSSVLAYCQAADNVLSLPNEQWHTPVGKALLSGKFEVLEYFISIVQHIRLYLPPSTSKAVSEIDLLLHRAVSSGQIEVVKFLLDIGYDINAPDETKSFATPLIVSARQAYTSMNMCHFLIEQGAHLNAVDKNHETALSTAVYFGFTKNAAMLIHHGADLNLPDSRSTTPLYWAIFNARISTLQLLIHAGAKFTHEQLRLIPKNLKVMRDPVLSSWMLEQVSNPRSLQMTCILMIRHHLSELSAGRSIFTAISQLPLPKSLQNMLTLA